MEHKIMTEARSMEETIRSDRRWLHAHAETGFDLVNTKEYVKNKLTEMGYTPTPCGRSGLSVTVGSGEKALLLRADMDALPIREESGEAFACPDGTMHACGHDLHTAMLLGAAQLLKNHETELQCTVKLMFQPAEEIFEGSKDMIDAGVLEDPKPDGALMIHVTAGTPLPAGTIVVSAPGVSAPAADYFTIHVQGRGCHGSAPQDGIDALTAAAHILIALQEISARELAASDEVVVTIGTMRAGTAGNVIADSAEMEGTIRCYEEDIRARLKDRITRIAQGVGSAFRTEVSVTYGSGCPPLKNDKTLSQWVYATLRESLGSGKVLSTGDFGSGKPARGGGSEDFAYISQQVPSLMLALAAGEPDKGFPYPQHHPKVRFDESVLPLGAAVFTIAALTYGS